MLDERQLKRFKNEARAAATLDHPNIVPIHSVGCQRGVHYYAMQFIDGQSLAEVICELRRAQKGENRFAPFDLTKLPGTVEHGLKVATAAGQEDTSPPIAEQTSRDAQAGISTERSITSRTFFHSVARFGKQAAKGLNHAHGESVIHRDIKPANLMVDLAGNLHIADFGLARIGDDAGMTMTGDLLGTLRYMSPEQVLGKRVVLDHRVDIYSLGVTLHELLTLRPPFDGVDHEQLLKQIALDEPVRLRRLNQSTPTELETIVLKAISKSPDDRYQSAEELADDLERFLENKPIHAKRPTVLKRIAKWSQRHRAVITVATVATILCLTLASALLWLEMNRTEHARREAEEARLGSDENVTLALTVLDNLYLQLLGDRLARGQEISSEERELLSQGIQFDETNVQRSSNRLESQAQMARASAQVGLIHERLGDRKKEEVAYRQALALYRQLAAQSPAEPAYLYHQALVLGPLARNQARLGHNTVAMELGSRAIAILHELHENHVDQPKYGLAMAGMHNDFSTTLANVLKLSEVERHHRTAIKLFDQLLTAFPDARLEEGFTYRDPRDGLAYSQMLLAASLPAEERGKSGELCRLAFDHFDKVAKKAPKSTWHREQLAAACLPLGNHVQDQAMALLAVKLFEQLREDFSGVPEYRARLARSSTSLGILLHRRSRQQEAEPRFRAAVRLMTGLVSEFPDVLDYHSELAAALHNLSTLPLDVLDLRETRRLLEQAIEIELVAVQANPEHRRYWRFLANHYNNLANVLRTELNDPEQAPIAVPQKLLLTELLAQGVPEENLGALLGCPTRLSHMSG